LAIRPISKVAHRLNASFHAHSAGHPWPAGDDFSQPPRSTTSTGGGSTGHANRKPLLRPNNPAGAYPRGGRAAHQLCWSSIPGTGDEASRWCDGRCSQGRESPPNEQESRIFEPHPRVVLDRIEAGVLANGERVHRLGYVSSSQLANSSITSRVGRATEQPHQVWQKGHPIHETKVHLDSVLDARPLDLYRDTFP
jgi:hypothetical protein